MFHPLLTTLLACATTPPGLDPVPAPVPEVAASEEPTRPSETLVLPEPAPTSTFTLRRGETIAHFARWSELPIEVVAEASGLRSTDDRLPVGAVVTLPIDDEARAIVDARREAHHLTRAEGYLESRGGALGAVFATVRTGDTATSIARDAGGIPVWLLETYNPSVDLERLRPGQELLVPVLGDPVAEGE